MATSSSALTGPNATNDEKLLQVLRRAWSSPFTTPVVYRTNNGDLPAKIVAVDADALEPYVARVELPDAVEFVTFAADGTRDDDGDLPKLVEVKKTTSIFANIYAPNGSQGNFRTDRETCEETNRGGRRAVLEVVYEGGIPIATILHHDARYIPDGFSATEGQ